MNCLNSIYTYNEYMEFHQLRAFVAVAEAGGFSKAAGPTASTQPTLSRQVKALEHDLGRALFDRVGREVSLTPYGREVLEGARDLLARAEALASSGRASRGRLAGVLRIGAADSLVMNRLPAILKRYRARHPDVRVHVRTARSLEILAWVQEGRCDVGLCMLPRAHPRLVITPLWDDRFIALIPRGHRNSGKRVSLSDFTKDRQIAIRPGTMSHQVLVSAFQNAGLSLVPDMVFETFQLVVEFIASGVGVGIASANVASGALKRGRVGRVRIPEIDGLTRRIGVVRHAERTLDGPVAALMEVIGQA